MTRALFSTAAMVAAIALCATSATALDMRQVETVVTILEQLSSETGKTVFYDEDAAQEWFEIDDESSQLIPAAGFSETSWKTAFDQTMTGFIASIPPGDREQMIKEFADKLGEAGNMTPEQKQAATEMVRAQMDNFDAIRAKGAQYTSAVAPYTARLKLLSGQQ